MCKLLSFKSAWCARVCFSAERARSLHCKSCTVGIFPAWLLLKLSASARYPYILHDGCVMNLCKLKASVGCASDLSKSKSNLTWGFIEKKLWVGFRKKENRHHCNVYIYIIIYIYDS